MKKWYHVSLLALVLAALLAALALPAALAAPAAETCSLTLKCAHDGEPMEGVTLRVYRVGRVNQATATFTPEGDYTKYSSVLSAPVEWRIRAGTLRGHVLAEGLPATAEAVSDETGTVRFGELPSGLYLILGDPVRLEGSDWLPVPCFLSLPNSYNEGLDWVFQVAGDMKFEQETEKPETVDRQVLIVWDDAGYESRRPSHVTVELLRIGGARMVLELDENGAVYDTQVIGAEHNWRHEWTGLDGSSGWWLIERDPGNGYTYSVEQKGTTFVVTNVYRGSVPPTPTPTPTPGGGDDPRPTRTPGPTPTATSSPGPIGPVETGGPISSPPPAVSPDPGGEDPVEEDNVKDNDVPLGELINGKDPGGEPGEEEDVSDPEIPLERLPQTGQLWWPVPFLAIFGLALILSGLIRRKRGELWDEEE